MSQTPQAIELRRRLAAARADRESDGSSSVDAEAARMPRVTFASSCSRMLQSTPEECIPLARR
eukprot:4663728-Prymnesium_polylepis.1